MSSRSEVEDGVGALPAASEGWWGAGIACGVVWISLCIVFRDSLGGLYDLWSRSQSYGHAFLVIPICAWVVWRERGALALIEPRPTLRPLLVVFGGTCAWAVSHIISIEIGEQLGLYLCLLGATWAVLGTRAMKVLAFPFLYLLLVIPIWSLFLPQLQIDTAGVPARMLQILGVPVLLEGHLLTIPNGEFMVQAECAGLRFLLAAMSIAGLYVYLTLSSRWRAAGAFMFAVVMGIVSNWLRVVIVVASGYLFGMHFPVVHGEGHFALGWFMFLLGLLPFLVLVGWLRRGDTHAPQLARVAEQRPPRTMPTVLAAVLAVGLGVLGPALAATAAPSAQGMAPVVFGGMPAVRGYRGPAPPVVDFAPFFPGADVVASAEYKDGRKSVQALLVYYASQTQGREAVNGANKIVGHGRWMSTGFRVVRSTLGKPGLPASANEDLARSRDGDQTRIIWSWYYVGGRFVTDRYVAKLLQLMALPILGHARRDAAVVAISVPADEEDPASARRSLAAFSRAYLPAVAEALQRLEQAR